MPMNHSAKSDEWISKAVAANPIKVAANGNIITCPVRITYANVFRPAPPQRGEVADPNKTPKFGATFLFPPGVEGQIESVIKPALLNMARITFPRNFDPDTGEVSGLHFPIRSQSEKIDLQGFTRGALFFNATSKYKPQIVDTSMNEITDESRIYNGLWVLAALNPYTFNDPKKKGLSLGLQMLMVFSDDTKLVSAKADPAAAFAGVKIDSTFDVDNAFGQAKTEPPARTGADTTKLW